jgi:hypothetical protein
MVVTWIIRTRAATAAKSTVIARGKATARAAGALTVAVRLTRSRRRMIGKSRRLRIVLRAAFRPQIGDAVSATSKLTLTRK